MMTLTTFLGLPVYRYGVAATLATTIALLLMALTFRRAKLKSNTLSIFACYALPLGLVLSHGLYGLSRLGWMADRGFDFLLHFTEGGYTFYGLLIGLGLAAFFTAKHTGQSALSIADAAMVPTGIFLAIVRMAEGLVEMGYGWDVESWFDPEMGMSLFHPENFDVFCSFPFSITDAYGQWCWAIFVVEAIIAVILAVSVARVRREKGAKVMLFVYGYAALQLLCESLRQDDVLRWGFVRVNQVYSAVALVAVLAILTYRNRENIRRALPAWITLVACALVVVAMEFALEKKIVFLEWMPMDVCYLITLCASLGMIFSMLPLWRKAYPTVRS